MRLTTSLTVMILAANLTAGELSPKVLRLIGPEARVVCGTDVGLYRNSALSGIFGMPGELEGSTGIRQVVGIESRGPDGRRWLTVVVGAVPGGKPDDGYAIQVLDANTWVFGDAGSVREAHLRWAAEGPPGETAAKVRRLAESYDNWFLAVKPLDEDRAAFGSGPDVPALKYRDEAVQAIEEVSGGIRFGAFDEFHGEAVLKAPEDAAAVATLARWIPGLIQMDRPGSLQSRLADMAVDLAIRAEGRSVSASFVLPEGKLREVREAARRVGSD